VILNTRNLSRFYHILVIRMITTHTASTAVLDTS